MSLTLDAQQHWLQHVRRVESPNCDERPVNEITLVVIHGISLPPGCYGGPYVDQLFTNSLDSDEHPYFKKIKDLRVSAHVFIDRQGDVTQYVPFHRRAWHAGQSCYAGRENCNDFSIGIELEGCDDEAYTDAQYETAATLVRLIQEHWPAIGKEQIQGHCHIAPGRKTDPGDSFDWDHFYALLD